MKLRISIGMLGVSMLGALALPASAQAIRVKVVDKPDVTKPNTHYATNREPLLPSPLVKLPFGSIKPQGWLRKQLELEADGFTGHLIEISPYCNKNNNAWLSPTASETPGGRKSLTG